ncbi:hypothetical protein J3459_014096 [Metarhizium acridum]|uniref:uncharacterized protein n=1 Tax=Metarhizium acridum TaxID=92637 RepID=UPI001C6AF6E1|nr:hypothetical protein J3458_021009 [Metarhizium acridum]KAG8414735.1 hypothetical protein J3459_014096 [Metarhizium acridum]
MDRSSVTSARRTSAWVGEGELLPDAGEPRLVDVADDDVGAALEVCACDLAAETAACACDEDCLAVEGHFAPFLW